MGKFIIIVLVIAVFASTVNVNRLGSSTVSTAEGINNTLLLPQDDPRSKTLLRTIIVIGGIAGLFLAFTSKKEDKK